MVFAQGKTCTNCSVSLGSSIERYLDQAEPALTAWGVLVVVYIEWYLDQAKLVMSDQ